MLGPVPPLAEGARSLSEACQGLVVQVRGFPQCLLGVSGRSGRSGWRYGTHGPPGSGVVYGWDPILAVLWDPMGPFGRVRERGRRAGWADSAGWPCLELNNPLIPCYLRLTPFSALS